MPANKTCVVGLTGGIGCGKSEAAAYLRSLGAVHVDADGISRELTAPGGAALLRIREVFGDGVFCPDGTLNRAALASEVFGSVDRRRMLEGILHPMIQREMLRRIDEAGRAGAKVLILDVPLLFESGMDVLCDEIWSVSTPHEVQVTRVMARGLTAEQAEARIASQMSSEERRARSTCVISTDRSVEKTQAELNSLYNQLLRRIG